MYFLENKAYLILSLLYDSVRLHEPKNPKTLKKYDVAFFYSRNSKWPPFVNIEKNEKCQNDK